MALRRSWPIFLGKLALLAAAIRATAEAFAVSVPRSARSLQSWTSRAATLPEAAGPLGSSSSVSAALAVTALAAGIRSGSRRNAPRKGRTAMKLFPWENDDPYSKCTALKLQIGMQFSKAMLDSLNKLADTADTSTEEGLHQLLLDVVLALRRQESSWRYGSCERLLFDAEDEGRAAGSAVQRWGVESQSKWGDGEQWEKMDKKTPGGMTEYIVVTMTLSCYGTLCPDDKDDLKVRGFTDVKKLLDAASGVQVDELMQLDVQWIPEEEGDSLSGMEVTMKFPELVML
mmetsp:Transcript_89802/g.159702  ORF Transcript_89802/g.159702 Transcript_89802/m.159702 type:complete len:287 (-) Transcript_89802:118-978(-)